MGSEETFHGTSFEGDGSLEHDVHQHPKRPDVDIKASVHTVACHFRSKVSRSATLLLDNFIWNNQLADPKVAKLDSAISIQENVVQLDVSVEYGPAVAVRNSVGYLLEDVLAFVFSQELTLLDDIVQITSSSVFGDHQDVFLVFKHFKEPDDVVVSDLLEDVHFLEHLLLRVVVLQLTQLDDLDGHLLSSQFVDCQVYLPESTCSNLLHEFVEVERRLGDATVLSDVLLVVLYYVVPFLHNFLVYQFLLLVLDVLNLGVDTSSSGHCGSRIHSLGGMAMSSVILGCAWLRMLTDLVPCPKGLLVGGGSSLSTALSLRLVFWLQKLLELVSDLFFVTTSSLLFRM